MVMENRDDSMTESCLAFWSRCFAVSYAFSGTRRYTSGFMGGRLFDIFSDITSMMNIAIEL